jgi:hypothetical protein
MNTPLTETEQFMALCHEQNALKDFLADLRFAQETAGKGQMNGQETWHLTAEATTRLKKHLNP